MQDDIPLNPDLYSSARSSQVLLEWNTGKNSIEKNLLRCKISTLWYRVYRVCLSHHALYFLVEGYLKKKGCLGIIGEQFYRSTNKLFCVWWQRDTHLDREWHSSTCSKTHKASKSHWDHGPSYFLLKRTQANNFFQGYTILNICWLTNTILKPMFTPTWFAFNLPPIWKNIGGNLLHS